MRMDDDDDDDHGDADDDDGDVDDDGVDDGNEGGNWVMMMGDRGDLGIFNPIASRIPPGRLKRRGWMRRTKQ